METFLTRVADVLEVASIGAGDEFRSVPMWSSLLGFGLLVMIEQEYGKVVAIDDFIAAKTVAELATLAGVCE